ncbi:MAG: hypothetical protein KGR16_07070 [Verrucomicrobia bacterium]|nr:hypothetical protein [Verrucomicrobiota bacterium]MDE3047862.1 hypothetical protein [Verrucomicrobiota bacterium]
MKITSKILSIHPYLSTTWDNISSFHARPSGSLFTLVVLLKNQAQIEIPNLDQGTINEIFEAHARYANETPKHPIDSPFTFSLPIHSDLLEGGGDTALQHNPEQANLPAVPPEVLKKIAMIARAFGLEGFFTKAEEGCNCMYCQLARNERAEEPVEEVTPEDLRFRDWGIEKMGDQIYRVTNPLDANEHYEVFLGAPIGCTCGNKNCEHIEAVLKS